jgi:hypothetical protein
MPSDRKINANRENAKKSTGPRSEEGRRKIRRNAFRHGLAIDVAFDPYFHRAIEAMAKIIVSASAQGTTIALARHLAETEVDILRIRDVRTALFNAHYEKSHLHPEDYIDLSDNLGKLERYERRAFSRRKRALRAISQLSEEPRT